MPNASRPDDTPWPAAWREVYPELKKIARARLHAAGPQAGLNTTALVNESYLRLSQRLGQVDFASIGHFYAYAAQVMRSVIVDELRERRADRRGGGADHVTLDTHVAGQLVTDDDEALQGARAVGGQQHAKPAVVHGVVVAVEHQGTFVAKPEADQQRGLTGRHIGDGQHGEAAARADQLALREVQGTGGVDDKAPGTGRHDLRLPGLVRCQERPARVPVHVEVEGIGRIEGRRVAVRAGVELALHDIDVEPDRVGRDGGIEHAAVVHVGVCARAGGDQRGGGRPGGQQARPTGAGAGG
ncbi:RNA polymerase sigma factor family [Ostertagia ostertagi]